MKTLHVTRRFISMYYEGFRDMGTLGRKLWIIIGVKFIVFFVIMKILFFPNFLKTNFANDRDRADHVIKSLLQGEK
ncbi:MAG: DUF4492 domain-containing protein [Campylobacterota bacterium]|nr:DUF4492 domain-containing protein [Campylobacterota bacterium]